MSDINKVVVDGVTYDIGGTVSGVKGDAESTYRTGNVNLTPANIGAKAVQSAVSSPSASGTGVEFIDTISQDAQGVITATKKTVREATTSQSGLMSTTQVDRLTYLNDALLTASDNFAPEVNGITYPIKAGTLFIRHTSWSTLTDSAGWHLCRALVDITSASGTTSDNKGVTYEDIKVSDLYEEVYALALAAYPTDTASGSAISITDGADGLPVKSLVVDIEPVQSGSGDPSPTNVRAISGWTGANVVRAGKNLIDIANTSLGITQRCTVSISGDVLTATCTTAGYVWIGGMGSVGDTMTNPAFTVSAKNGVVVSVSTSFQMDSCTVYELKADNKILSSQFIYSKSKSGTYTVTSDDCAKLAFRFTFGDAAVGDVFSTTIQLELGSTATAYEPYQGSTLSITFPSEAGTVYGGTLDVTNGVLTADRAIFTVTSEKLNNAPEHGWNSTYGAWVRNLNYNEGITKEYFDSTNTVPCSFAPCVVNNRNITSTQYRTSFFASGWTSYDDFANAVASLEQIGTPMTYVAPLATPVTYQLTPQEVDTLLGNNTIYADTGDVTVTYRADPTLFASKGQTEDDMTADAAIASGAYFQIGNTLYKATAAIATGETIVPGTNCTVTNIAEALNLLNA